MNHNATELRELIEPVCGDGLDDAEIVERHARAAWSCIVEPGDALGGIARELLGADASLRMLMRAEPLTAWMSALGDADVDPAEVSRALDRWRPRVDAGLFHRALRQGARWGQRLVVPGDAHWPHQLDDLGPHAPAVLWARGRVDRLPHMGGAAALVGARASTAYGTQIAAELAEGASGNGIPVVSGGAFGIDAAAHRVTLAAGGFTVCVLAGGLDRWYPAANSDLIGRIAEEGIVIAEVPSGVTPSRWRFLQRNRLIAALSAATIVVEAGRRSGAINTAGHAAALGRPLGAVPGSVTSGTSAGCHRVIREHGAELVEGTDDLLRLVRGDDVGRPLLADAVGSLEVRVLDAMSERSARTSQALARASGLSMQQVLEALGMLDLIGRVEQRGSGWVKHR